MELIPVIDLMRGQVIRGRAGQREHYQANISRLVPSADPAATCRALTRHYRPQTVYVADLDGIQHAIPQFAILESLCQCRVEIAVDAGTSSVEQAIELVRVGVKRVVVGLETLPNLALLKQFVHELGPEHVIFSLDMMNGEPMGADGIGKVPVEVAAEAMEHGIRQMILLDLSHVGTQRGVPTSSLCHVIKNRWPDLVVWTGGGVRSLADLHQLSLSRADGAMVASALHDGQISPADWRNFRTLSNDSTQLAMDA